MRGSRVIPCEWWALVWVVVLGCSRSSPPSQSVSQEDLVARIGSHEIRAADFEERMGRRAVGDDPAKKAALLEEMIEFGALVEQARKLGLDRDPALRRSWENLLVSKLRETLLEPQWTNATPTPEQVRRHYESNRARFTEAAQRRGAVVFLSVPAKATDERKATVRRRAEEARAKALAQVAPTLAVPSFAAVAVEYSEDQATRYRGGDMGWVRAGRGDARYDPAVIGALFKLDAVGGISELIETAQGYYLVRLTELRGERVKPLEEVQKSIEHELMIENRKRIEAEWKQQIRAGFPVERFPAVLARIQPPARSPAPVAPPPVP